MKATTIALIASAGVFATASAFAEHHKGDDTMDVNAKIEAAFAKVDANADGNISSEEYLAYKAAEAEKAWAEYATAAGDDGLVSLDEAKAHHAAKMAKKEAMMADDGKEMMDHGDKEMKDMKDE